MRVENTPEDISDFPLTMASSGVYDDVRKAFLPWLPPTRTSSDSSSCPQLDQIQMIETYKPKQQKSTKKKFKRIGQSDPSEPKKASAANALPVKKKAPESLDFHDCESMMYRKVSVFLSLPLSVSLSLSHTHPFSPFLPPQHETRRFFQDRGHFWNKSRLITFWKWAYVVFVGVIVGCIGTLVTTLINALLDWKFTTGSLPPPLSLR
jgi:hypothetical protein